MSVLIGAADSSIQLFLLLDSLTFRTFCNLFFTFLLVGCNLKAVPAAQLFFYFFKKCLEPS